MHPLVASCVLASVLFSACNSGSGTQSSSAAPPASKPGLTAAPQPSLGTTTAPGTNPPHGQPGHRCDIAVGAPLNSKPAPSVLVPGNQPPSTLTVNQAPAQPTGQAPINMTGKRLNPPHGQPGHDCTVQVGQPLP